MKPSFCKKFDFAHKTITINNEKQIPISKENFCFKLFSRIKICVVK